RSCQQDRAFDDHLVVRTDVVEIEAVVQDANEEGAGQRAPNRSPAAKEACPADDDGGNRVELEQLASLWVAGVEARDNERTREASAKAAQRIDGQQHAIHPQAREPRRVAVPAN